MPQQLAFDWPVGVALGAQDFFVSTANHAAYDLINAPERWPNGKLSVIGPKGCGKSHLARVFAAQAGARIVAAADVAHGPPPTTAVVVEDMEGLLPAGEEPLFHLHNNLAAAGLPLLLTARTPPARWNIALPDLASRMQATTPIAIAEPDDALLQALIMKLFADRQIVPKASLVVYLARNIERSYAAAAGIVAKLDGNSMARGVPIGRKLAAQLLDNAPSADE